MTETAARPASAALRERASTHVPGEPGVWLLIFGEMTIFAAMFASYLYYRSAAAAEFSGAQAALSRPLAVANTILLLTSSLFVAQGVQATARGSVRTAPGLFAAGLGFGLGFIALKAVEYHLLIAQSVTLDGSVFFAFYFGLTALHLIHVVAGCFILALLVSFTRKPLGKPSSLMLVESAGCWWHMVDLLWIIIFPLLYLVK